MTEQLSSPLHRQRLDADPFQQFRRWLTDAEQAGIELANAMTLATADRDGKPAARIVLLRGLDERGFAFFSNYHSRKGQQLGENPFAALVFYWPELARQVRIEGTVELLSLAESDHYFASRPRGHQLEAHASAQSQVIASRQYLEQEFSIVEQQFAGRDVPRPQHWGGYRVVPQILEFWQQGAHRLHDRLRYRRFKPNGWVIERLAP
ncbi:pyridoxamine 5'-phosphate oxidase [Pelobacter seleniigenes]|uniref:pyridoxamine 5'-phosphate oxidase n=1 Tax=Pelobacter seleniigenes TaxID=407188 RepID=UPI0004A6CD93|nr:pyridoxamine 5'-phosphate oxidase [Pelobacter seleniigenes]